MIGEKWEVKRLSATHSEGRRIPPVSSQGCRRLQPFNRPSAWIDAAPGGQRVFNIGSLKGMTPTPVCAPSSSEWHAVMCAFVIPGRRVYPSVIPATVIRRRCALDLQHGMQCPSVCVTCFAPSVTSHLSVSPRTSHLEVLLVRTERIPVMLPNHGFHFIGVVGFDRFENLTVFFLSFW